MKSWDEIYKKKGVVQEGISQNIADAVNFFKKENAKKVLDLGCGTGRHMAYMQKLGFEISGCDISPEAIATAGKEIPGAKLDVCEMSSLPYEDAVFDAVMCTDVLQHGKLDYIKKAISEIHRVMKKGSILFLTVCSTEHPKFRTGEEIEPNTRINTAALDGHVPHHFFTGDELRQIFSRFDIVSLEHVTRESPIDPGKKSAAWQMYAKNA